MPCRSGRHDGLIAGPRALPGDPHSAIQKRLVGCMKKNQLENFRKTLLEQKKKLLEKVESSVKTNKEEDKEEVGDAADIASDYYERELAMNLSEAERQRLREVEDALERIEAGSYGQCESCSNMISTPRLEALPFAKLCIECQAKEEQSRKTAL